MDCETCPVAEQNLPVSIEPLLGRITMHQRIDLQIALCASNGCLDDSDGAQLEYLLKGLPSSPFLEEALQIIQNH